MRSILVLAVTMCVVLSGFAILPTWGGKEPEKEVRIVSHGTRATRIVGPGQTYTTIGAAITAASAGDIIRVYSGIYKEQITVNKVVSLIGNGTRNTTIDGKGTGDVVTITTNWVNITGFTIKNSGSNKGGIYAISKKYCRIVNNNISGNGNGICFISCNNNILSNNTLTSNRYYGIYLVSTSDYNNIINNTINSNDIHGIYLGTSHYNVIANNTAANNNYGIYLTSTANNKVRNNTISNNDYGIYIDSSVIDTITNNSVLNNGYGIRVSSSTNTIFLNNSINFNTMAGIYFSSSSSSTVSNNTMMKNGIDFSGSTLSHWNSHIITTTNTVNGKPVQYWKDITSGTVPFGAGQVILVNCKNAKVINQTINDTTRGIILAYSSRNDITNNTLSNNRDGIYLTNSNSNNITNNIVNSSISMGIYPTSSNSNTFAQNNISNNLYGVYNYITTNNIITNNSLTNNQHGIYLSMSTSLTITNNTMMNDGILISSGTIKEWNTHTISTSNTVNGKPVQYWKNITSGTIPLGTGQVILANCSKIIIKNQNLSGGEVGVLLGFSSRNHIINSSSFNDFYGIYFYNSNGNNITNYTANSNRWYGISIQSSKNNNITNSTFSNNEYGISISNSYYNSIANNSASNNDTSIYLSSSTGTVVKNNTVYSKKDGIYVSSSPSSTITNNTIINAGITISGWTVTNWNTHTIPTTNTVNGKPVYYWKNRTGGTIPSGAGQVILANCSNIVIKNQNVSNASIGIQLGVSNSNILANNTASNAEYGIYLEASNKNLIINNTVNSNDWDGIKAYYSNSNILSNNTASMNKWSGISIYYSTYNTLLNNTMANDGIYLIGHLLTYWNTHNINTSNTVNGKPVQYWKNQTGGTVPAGAGQIILANCSNVRVIDQNVSYGSVGILFGFSNCNTVTNNSVSSNTVYGIYLYYSSWNTVYNNRFINNKKQAYDSKNDNSWNLPYPGKGNYWSDYTGTDQFFGVDQNILGPDGIGDTSYTNIDGHSGTKDNYPLMFPGSPGADMTPPISSVKPITPYWRSSGTLTLIALAFDSNTSVVSVEFWYRYSSDNGTWGIWKKFGNDTTAGNGWSASFNYPDGEGYYEFYSRAGDLPGNYETPPLLSDARCGLDATPPEIKDTSLAIATTGDLFSFSAVVTDDRIISLVRVIYWFGSGSKTNTTMTTISLNNFELNITIPQNSIDTLHYWIYAVDHVLNGNDTSVKDITVKDNDIPFADAGSNQTVDEENIVTFTGSGSSDNIGIINYTWTFKDGIGDVKLYGISPSHMFTEPGEYIIRLNVSDSAGNWANDTLNVTVRDITIPFANAGPDQIVDMGDIIIFNGSGSIDNVGVVNYTWTVNDGGLVKLYSVEPSRKFDNAGTFVVILNVTDAAGNWDIDTMTVTVNDTQGPTANAGPDQTVDMGDIITFDGSGSIDNVGIVKYNWSFIDSDIVTLFNIGPTHRFDYAGIYVVTLNVSDAAGNWAIDTMTVTVNDTQSPVANAGPDQAIDMGSLVNLDGSGSTDNVGIVKYNWSFTDSGFVILLNIGPTHSFDYAGVFVVTLNVSDVAGNWDLDTMIVTVNDTQSPVADAGPDQIVDMGDIVAFNGSSSQDNVGIVNYTWKFNDGVMVIRYGETPSYKFNNAGIFSVLMNITDAIGHWDIDTMTVTVNDTQAPIANAGPDQIIDMGDLVMFNGSASTDNVGIVKYSWCFTNGNMVTLLNIGPTYTFDNAGEYSISLNVTDAMGNWAVDDMTVTVNDIQAPVANAGADQTVDQGSLVKFNGSNSSDNIGIENYVWSFRYNGNEIKLYGPVPSFTFATSGEYIVTLNVTDVAGNWNVDTVTISVLSVGDDDIDDDITPATDTDSDGLPDSWEMSHFSNLDAKPGDDPDKDGLTNLQEYQQGKDPNKADNPVPDDDTDDDVSDDDTSSNLGLIIAGIVAAVVILLIIVGIIVFLMMRKKKQEPAAQQAPGTPTGPTPETQAQTQIQPAPALVSQPGAQPPAQPPGTQTEAQPLAQPADQSMAPAQDPYAQPETLPEAQAQPGMDMTQTQQTGTQPVLCLVCGQQTTKYPGQGNWCTTCQKYA